MFEDSLMSGFTSLALYSDAICNRNGSDCGDDVASDDQSAHDFLFPLISSHSYFKNDVDFEQKNRTGHTPCL